MGLYYDWYMKTPTSKPESHPLRVAEEIEAKSLSNAKKGLQMAINDIVESSSDWTPERIANADARFREKNVITLSEVRQRYSKKYLNILKRGKIKSEEEYYLIKGIADCGGIEPGATESQQMEAMLNEYENRVVKSK